MEQDPQVELILATLSQLLPSTTQPHGQTARAVVGSELAYNNVLLLDLTFGPHAMAVLAESFDPHNAMLALRDPVGEFWEREPRGHAA